MIQNYIDAWMKYKDKYRKWLESIIYNWDNNPKYIDLIKHIIADVINPYLDEEYRDFPFNEKLMLDKLKVIDDGYYQGTQIFILPIDTYAPMVCEYVFTHTFYGSCSGCDALLDALSQSEYDEPLSKNTVDDLMTISLHLIEKFRPLAEEMEY